MIDLYSIHMDPALTNQIIIILVNAIGLCLALWVYLADRKSKVNKYFFLMVIAWLVVIDLYHLMMWVVALENTFPVFKMGVACVFTFVIFVYFFSLHFLGEERKFPLLNKLFLLIGIGGIPLSLLTNVFTKGVEVAEYGRNPLLTLPGKIIFLGYCSFGAIFVLIRLLSNYFKSPPDKRLRVQYFLIGFSLFLIIDLSNVFLWLARSTLKYFYISGYSVILMLFFTSIAIIKRQLFGIKVVLTDLLVGIMAIILLVLVFLMPTGLLKLLLGVVFLLFCFFGYYLMRAVREEERRKKEAQRVAEEESQMRQIAERLAAEEAQMRQKAERFKKIIVALKERLFGILDLEEVVSRFADTLLEGFGINKISFALKQPTSEFYQFYKTLGFQERSLGEFIRYTSLCFELEERGKPLLREELTPLKDKIGREDLKIILAKMEENEVELILPLSQKIKVIGIVFLGRKSSGEPYSKEDLDLLETISYQISICFNNSLLYEEIKKTKEVLERFYNLSVGRELRMVELKKKIKELEEKLKGKGDK